MPPKPKRPSIQLPEHTFPVISKGKVYYYFQRGRGSADPGPRHSLPRNFPSFEFWSAYRELLGEEVSAPALTIGDAIDKWLLDVRAKKGIQPSSVRFYEQSIRPARKAWGGLAPGGLKPLHVETLFNSMHKTPGAANNFLSAMRSFGKWLRKHELSAVMITEGISAHRAEGGHQPWTPEQLAIAEAKLTGAVRRGYFLYRYTGLRGSDVVRLGPQHIIDGCFEIVTQKRMVPIVCPILPELEAEMRTWPDEPGPFLKQGEGRAAGRPFSRKHFSVHFREQREKIAGLANVTLHGLRATAVGRLRAGGVQVLQICDIVGMSPPMVERYSRFVDRRDSAKAGIRMMLETEAKAATAKHSENAKQISRKNNKVGGAR